MFPEVPQPAHTQKLRATETTRIQIVKDLTHAPSLCEQRISISPLGARWNSRDT